MTVMWSRRRCSITPQVEGINNRKRHAGGCSSNATREQIGGANTDQPHTPKSVIAFRTPSNTFHADI